MKNSVIRNVRLGVLAVAMGLQACTQTATVEDLPQPVGPVASSGQPLQRAVERIRTPAAEYAKERAQQSFYVRLRSTPLWIPASQASCVDASFGAWFRKWFHRDSATSALVLRVRAPGEANARAVPLFETTVAEAPGRCTSRVVDGPITPFYVVDPGQGFNVDVDMKWSKKRTVTGATSVVQAATSLLGLTSGSAALASMVAPEVLAEAAAQVDRSIAQHWQQGSQDRVTTQISPYPRSGVQWSAHKDALVFRTAQVVARWRGVEITPERMPGVRVEPEYLTSYFSINGSYVNAARMLIKPIGIEGERSLRDLLRVGFGGLNTVAARQITTGAGMRQFCADLRQLLSRFLTRRDELAARYAVLALETTYLDSAALRDPQCVSEAEVAELATLNPTFSLPDIGARQADAARDEQVRVRLGPVTRALRQQDQEALESLIANPETFTMQVIDTTAFPKREDGEWGGLGNSAIKQLTSLSMRSGCYKVPARQSLAAIAMIVLLPNNNTTGVLTRFDERGGLKALFFADPDLIADLTGLSDWPDHEDCALL